MAVFLDLFSDFTGWLTLGVLAFIFVMMFYLLFMFVGGGKKN